MSFFGVTIRNIEKVWRHPNADKLDLAKVSGCAFQFVVMRDQFKGGELVLYFPVDAILPGWIIAKLGLTGKLSGKEKNRIKTVRLRGEISQGIVALLDTDFLLKLGEGEWTSMSPDGTMYGLSVAELTKRLEVTKYEPPVVPCHTANLVGMPDGIGVYDVEGADFNPDIVELLMDQMVCITEKAEGTNFWVSATPCDSGSCEISVGQRHHEIKPIEGAEHDFWRITKDLKLDQFARYLAMTIYDGKHRVVLRGEYIGPGVQGNYYKLEKNKVLLFDILVGSNYLPPQEFFEACWGHSVDAVPLISKNVKLRDWLTDRTLREASNGASKIALNTTTLREGIVIKPMKEQYNSKIGRLMIKQRDPVYLAETDA